MSRSASAASAGIRARLARAGRAVRYMASVYDELYTTKWRSSLQREARRQQDLLVTLTFLEALGVDNPAGYYTLELHPELVASFHDWHRREGMERSPEPGVCC